MGDSNDPDSFIPNSVDYPETVAARRSVLAVVGITFKPMAMRMCPDLADCGFDFLSELLDDFGRKWPVGKVGRPAGKLFVGFANKNGFGIGHGRELYAI